MRLRSLLPEYRGRVTLRVRPFPLEVMGGEAAPRHVLDQEWWLAAIQEPAAEFQPFRGDDWPTTTLPAFEAAWCAKQQGEDAFFEYDFRVRRAFFAESRNIGRPTVLREIAEEAGLDLARFDRDFTSEAALPAVLEEARLGKETYRVRGTPTVMLPDGSRLRHPIAYPRMRDDRIVSISPLPCRGEECLQATRELFEKALEVTHG